MKFRKKPIIIEAFQWRGQPVSEWPSWAQEKHARHEIIVTTDGPLHIKTLEGAMVGLGMDWIIQGVKGEVYPCKPDIFVATYETVE